MEDRKLIILREIPSCKVEGKYVAAKYEVKCFCGNIFISDKNAIKYGMKGSGGTKSCGCLFKEIRKMQTPNKKHGIASKDRRLYSVWHSMMQRCYSTNCSHYDSYGGRGIKVCDEWKEVNVFYEWAIKNGYDDKLTIDRINNDGNYTPLNCRFISMKEQSSNKRNNINYTYKGETKNLSQWAESLEIPISTLRNRIKVWGITIEEAFEKDATKPIINKRGYVMNPDISVCIKNKMKIEGRKHIWLIKKLSNKGIIMSSYTLSVKINGKCFFTLSEIEAINQILGTNFK